ncbi:MAG: leucine-rich repeat domain-containing protein [Clostridia bacterium]|nr:leucine-rich repeat domain-containing protein [Clostridia bacterium]
MKKKFIVFILAFVCAFAFSISACAHKGNDGRGIADMQINSNGELVITYTDGTTANLGKIIPGEEKRYTEGLLYEEIKYGDTVVAYTVAGLGTATDMNIVIPPEYMGKPVTEIKDYALYCPYGTPEEKCPVSIDVGDVVQRIGEQAFGYNSYLKTISIGKSVERIGRSALYYCRALETVYWNATACKVAGTRERHLFLESRYVKEIFIGDNVKYIPDYAFMGSQSIKSITIPDSVVYIGEAFLGCTMLSDIYYNSTTNYWDLIVKKENWDYLINQYDGGSYTIHCLDEDIVKE